MGELSVIITGSTGMVGEGVLHECLLHPDVERVLVVNRKTCDVVHPKLTEILNPDFFDLSSIENQLSGYNACFFCLGISSVGVSNEDYYHTTYDLTLNFAETLVKQNSGMSFIYVSGAGTDSSEKGRVNWARVKGKTENDLMKLPFKNAFAFRPAFMQPTEGLKHTKGYYSVLKFLFPIFKLIMPSYVSTLKEVGIAMINLAIDGYEKQVIEVKDINILSKKTALYDTVAGY
jgi:uncharacterized protein YbjT (DUF2867 family)